MIWKTFPHAVGYEVSDTGLVRSIRRIVSYMTKRGTYIERTNQSVLLQPYTMPTGHQQVVLANRMNMLVHRMVLLTFVGEPPEGMESLHGNGIPWDNRLENLRWGTRADNNRTEKWLGQLRANSKLTVEDVVEIKNLIGTMSQSDLGQMFGVTQAQISQIKMGNLHTDIAP